MRFSIKYLKLWCHNDFFPNKNHFKLMVLNENLLLNHNLDCDHLNNKLNQITLLSKLIENQMKNRII